MGQYLNITLWQIKETHNFSRGLCVSLICHKVIFRYCPIKSKLFPTSNPVPCQPAPTQTVKSPVCLSIETPKAISKPMATQQGWP